MALVKYNNNSISAVTSTGLATGSLVPIKTLTASSSATLSFVDGTDGVVLDSTYPIYRFEFINCHPATNATVLSFQADTGTNTNYNQTMTTTLFRANQAEDDGGAALSYRTGSDQAQGTAFQEISQASSNDNDSGVSGVLKLFNPSSTTFVKHFISETNTAQATPDSQATYCAGYFNTTTALTRVQFKFASGNIDSGKIKLYGIKDS
jgi:hypothetical protein